TMGTWRANGGQGSPQHASREEQIRVAENVLRTQGIKAWPVCGRRG
ncbi:MAG: resuscitation-promoting factor RpfE, partial [Mycobacterium sp.]|nr:resuscitation-promoting factor RpfE [Mycobacterium sp.]